MNPITVVINTCALGRDGEKRSSKGHGPTYASRARLLRERILPRIIEDPYVGKVFVTGEWEKGDGYEYVVSQCWQKDAVHDYLTGGVVAYLCDDHIPEDNFFTRLSLFWHDNMLWDVISPIRSTPEGKVLATGWAEGYTHAHGIIMRHGAVQRVPWLDVWKEVRGIWHLDILMTRLWQQRGLRIMTDPGLVMFDIEEEGA
jgi:hypothetical protein